MPPPAFRDGQGSSGGALGGVVLHTGALRPRNDSRLALEAHLGFDANGGRLARLWSENKTGADYQPDQLPEYADGMPELPAQRRLITVVEERSQAPADLVNPENPRWLPFTWREVAVMAWEAGRDGAPCEDRASWKEAALRPDAPASQRILFELLNYLEEEHRVVLNPLGYENVAALAHITDTGNIIHELLKRAAEFAHANEDGGPEWRKAKYRLWQSFDATGTWAEALGGAPKLYASDTDSWNDNRIGEPALGAGFSLPEAKAVALRDEALRPWSDAVRAEGFSVSVEAGYVRVWRTKYLAELIPAGVTLDLQAKQVALWLDETLSLLAGHNPGKTVRRSGSSSQTNCTGISATSRLAARKCVAKSSRATTAARNPAMSMPSPSAVFFAMLKANEAWSFVQPSRQCSPRRLLRFRLWPTYFGVPSISEKR